MSDFDASAAGPAPRPLSRAPRGAWRRGRTALLHLVYDGSFLLLIVLGLPWFLLRFATSRRFRRGLPQRLGFVPLRSSKQPCIWIHGVSVGEVKAAGALARGLRERFPGCEIVFSATTQTGFELARELYRDNLLFYYPLDAFWIVSRVFRRIRPNWIVLVELEIWPNLLLRADRAGVPVMVVNGRISERSWRGYRRLRRFLPEFTRIRHTCAQNETYRERFLDIGVPAERVSVTGNVKFDNLRARGDLAPDAELRRLFGIAPDDCVFVAGSTHPGEERAALAAARSIRESGRPLRLIVAPRHPPRLAEVLAELREQGGEPVRLTELRSGAAQPSPTATYVVDTIGELERVYSLAAVVFVGGSLFPKGGHNVLEPAALGKPVLFGPHTFNFDAETALLLERRAARRIADDAELCRALRELLEDPEEAKRMGQAAIAAIEENRGATARTIAALEPILRESAVTSGR
ncbi:MAG: 3-deoxy-D-manno-octulosonic acid transferase [Planctomycetes bacterium]|nr:3-deoxy-D-manno-octulosonic acid transferase [Planctomycetota bacterium]